LRVGEHLADGIRSLAKRHECIGDVRGTGLFLAVELVSDRQARTPATKLAWNMVNDLRERGVLTGSIGPDDNILKLRPPMVLTRSDADYMLDILDQSLAANAAVD
jgi:4-aminobutyrate aminotransferase-like enzyme